MDFGLLEMLDIEIAEGRSFSPELISDTLNYMINEEAAKIMGIENSAKSNDNNNLAFPPWGITRICLIRPNVSGIEVSRPPTDVEYIIIF